MFSFIIICMLVVLGFETIGLLQKEKNLDNRLIGPSIYTKIKAEQKAAVMDISEEVLFNKIEDVKIRSKEERNDQILQILANGALNQLNYLSECPDCVNILSGDDDRSFMDV